MANNSRNPLLVLKASAGAGKTYRLTQEYIDLLIGAENCAPDKRPSPDSYKHILAVTFTNKATDEMKTRIIQALYDMASDSNNPRQKPAKEVLIRILHDYSYFSISTIDSFFQMTMRAFAREIGQYSSYKVELDTKSIMKQSIDKMIASLEEKNQSDLLKWLIDYSIELIESGKQWDFSDSLLTMLLQFMREDYKLKKRDLGSVLNQRNMISNFKDEMNAIISQFKKDTVDVGNRGCNKIKEYSLTTGEYYKGYMNCFEKWKDGSLTPPHKSFINFQDNPDSWCAKNSPVKSSILASYYGGLNDLVKEAVSLFDSRYKAYCTAVIIRDNLFVLGIFSDIYQTMVSSLKEDNVVLLSETADVLNRIIDGSDTPFIYEKIGTRFDHFMLDEFQDTSTLQWENLQPLVADSVSKAQNNLIVGDVKQSIYRFRNSDWTLLDNKVDTQFQNSEITSETMEENWRSSKNIIAFNNDIFATVLPEENIASKYRQSIGDILANSVPEIADKVKKIYNDAAQKTPDKKSNVEEGHVKLTFVDTDVAGESADQNEFDADSLKHWQNKVLNLLPDQLDELKSKGYQLNDVAFLVRRNAEASIIASTLMKLGYKVVTEEALSINSAYTVKRIISHLKYIVNPDDKVNNLIYSPDELVNTVSIDGASLFDICEQIIRDVIGDVPESDVPFVQSFLDWVMTYTDKYGSSITGFLNWWEDNGNSKYISVPADKDAIQVMTIHKSKGLGFKVVFLPFLTEIFFDTRKPHYLWVHPNVEPFSKIGLIPLSATSSMLNTYFDDDYKKEVEMAYIDAINTVYVAMTRAKNELFVYCPLPNIKKNEIKIDSFSSALYVKYQDQLKDNVYEIGETATPEGESEENAQIKIPQTRFISIPIGKRLGPSFKASDYFDKDQQNAMQRGIVLHDILSRIDDVNDLERSVNDSVRTGEIPQSSASDTIRFLLSAISSVKENHWFDNTYQDLNEVSIVDANGNVTRPDRVLIDRESNTAIVVDYKFGKHNSSYDRQVSKYCTLLREMGFSRVKGFIWYVGEEVVPVK